MTAREPAQRPAYEPVDRLLRPTPYDPDMPRPATTVAGACLVLLGALVSVLSMIDLAAHWRSYAASIVLELDGVAPGPEVFDASLAAISIVTAFVSWWVRDQEITLQTTLLSLAVDILVLLALSSRSAAAYARRREKH